MKQIALLFAAITFLFLVTIMFDSCKKENSTNDGGSSSGSGEIEYLGKKYDINTGYYEVYGQFEGIYNYQLYLFSEGVDIENESGIGNVIAIYFSTYSAPLPIGTVPYYSEFVEPIPTFEAEVVLDYNLETEDGIRLNYFVGGEIKITKSTEANTFTIQFNCILQDEETLSGNYSGTIYEF